MSDSILSLLSLLIGAGSLWLALDFARHRSVWFAVLFALLTPERPTGRLPRPEMVPMFGLRMAVARAVGRLVFLPARRYRLELSHDQH